MPKFEILDYVDTPMGPLCLRRREVLARPGTLVTEVSIGAELLMSSYHTVSEEALATRSAGWHGGSVRRVLVGGLGLGYTARAALLDPSVQIVRVVEQVPAVIGWLRRGLVPLSEELNADPRLEVVEGDVYSNLLAPADEIWDLILIDVDHTPTERLGDSSKPFYTAAGLERVTAHLAPDGVLAVWSAADDGAFASLLADSFGDAHREYVTWVNDLIDQREEFEDVIFLARGRPQLDDVADGA